MRFYTKNDGIHTNDDGIYTKMMEFTPTMMHFVLKTGWTGWFLIDFIATFPWEMLLEIGVQSDKNDCLDLPWKHDGCCTSIEDHLLLCWLTFSAAVLVDLFSGSEQAKQVILHCHYSTVLSTVGALCVYVWLTLRLLSLSLSLARSRS